MDISSPLGGGKFKPIIKEIINAEREPIRQIEARKAKENDRLKLVQDFQTKVRKLPELLRELESFNKFRELKADWPAKDIMDVSVDKEFAMPGEYEIEVVQLAGRHSMISDGYESVDDEVGIGVFSYSLPNGESRSVFVGPSNNTLRGLANLINQEKDLNLQASVINDGSGSDQPWRIVVTSKKSGIDNDTEFPEFYFLDGDFRFYADDERSAQNAIVKFNGFEIMSPSNKFELLPGVTLDLLQAKEDYEFTLSITEDTKKIAGKVKALVDSINEVLEFINKQNQLDAHSDTSRTLGGDTTLFAIESQVRNAILANYQVEEEDEDIRLHLSDVGVQFEKTGLLKFNEDKFKRQMDKNFDQVASLFATPGNFVERAKNMADGFLRPEYGVISSRERGIRERIKKMDDEIIQREDRLDKREKSLKRQFAQLEGLIGSSQGQQAFLQQALGGTGQITV
ncbi:MAG: flagellar filament capping protein FliD [Bacteriovoracia bacterium]